MTVRILNVRTPTATQPLLSEIRRVLTTHGIFLASTPKYPAKRFYDLDDTVFHRGSERLRDDPTHITLYNHRMLSRLLRDYFTSLVERSIKGGFVYRRLPRPQFRHKIFYLCTGSS